MSKKTRILQRLRNKAKGRTELQKIDYAFKRNVVAVLVIAALLGFLWYLVSDRPSRA